MAAAVERFGPQIGTLLYEQLRADFVPMNPPADEMILDHFIAPMPHHEVNLPQVPTHVEWNENATNPLGPEEHDWMEGFLGRFFSRATLQGVAEDVVRVEVFRMLHPEGEETLDDYDVIVKPVIRGGMRFENEFERQILFHKVGTSLGSVFDNPITLLPSFTSEDFHPTLEDRMNGFTVKTELLATAKLQPQEVAL